MCRHRGNSSMKMYIFILFTIGQVFLPLVIASDGLQENKRVVCYYAGLISERQNSLYPEDIDASICTHLVYLHGGINTEIEEIYIKPLDEQYITGGAEILFGFSGGWDGRFPSSGCSAELVAETSVETAHLTRLRTRREFLQIIRQERMKSFKTFFVIGYTGRLLKLKEVNPNLKLLLFVSPDNLSWVLMTPARRSKIIKSAIELLNLTRFDGLEFSTFLSSNDKDELADLFCEMQSEFKKYGYTVSTMFSDIELTRSLDSVIDKMARCCDFITLRTIDYWGSWVNTTRLLAPLNLISSEVDWYLERGLPANKLLITIPAFGMIATLTDATQTGLGASISGPGNEDSEFTENYTILYNQLAKRLNDSTEGWTIHRDDKTNAPYAYSKTGIWTSYEDTSSAETKARYVVEKNLGGALIVTLEMDDFEGMEGAEKFPITRTIHSTFKQGLEADNPSP